MRERDSALASSPVPGGGGGGGGGGSLVGRDYLAAMVVVAIQPPPCAAQICVVGVEGMVGVRGQRRQLMVVAALGARRERGGWLAPFVHGCLAVAVTISRLMKCEEETGHIENNTLDTIPL